MTRANPQLPPYPPITPPPGAGQPKRKTPSWVWALAAVATLVMIGAGGHACHFESNTASSTPSSTAPTFRPFARPHASDSGYRPIAPPPTPVPELTVPDDLVGENGAMAAAALKRLGFENVHYVSGTRGVEMVLMLSTWTVVEVEPGPDAVVGANTPIRLTMVKNR